MKLKYDIADKPPVSNLLVFALQQMLTILAATIAVPMTVGHGLSPAAAMFGAGAGTIVYFLLTKRRSPVFLGSSFSFVGAMLAAFAGGVSMQLGMLGMLIGAASAGIVYVILSLVVRKTGTGWIDKVMPPVVIGPVVSVIGLSLAGNAVRNLSLGNVMVEVAESDPVPVASPYAALACGLVALAVTIISSVYGRAGVKLIPFLIGIIAAYIVALAMTLTGTGLNIPELLIIDLDVFRETIIPDGTFTFASVISIPDFVFPKAIAGAGELTPSYVVTIITAFIPIAFVGFAEHIADHKNLSMIIGKDLLTDPGLHRTLIGDGLGSITGAFFGGCANTTYGESIACVALTGNASTITIFAASAGCMALSFFTPFVAFVETIPKCVMGGLCIALYGFIAVSGLKMIQHLDFEDNGNIFVVSVILITGIGGLVLQFGSVSIDNVAVSLILGMITNFIVAGSRRKQNK